MKKFVCVFMALMIIFVAAGMAGAKIYGGVEFPDGEKSFADEVAEYIPADSAGPPHNNPEKAIGIPDGLNASSASQVSKVAVSLGNGGVLILKFTDNSLTASGDDSKDLWIFETGSSTELTAIAVSTDGVNWIDVGETKSSTSGIDIDSYTDDGIILGEKYSFVKITDLSPSARATYEGADIDAVGAISSSTPVPSDDYPVEYKDFECPDCISECCGPDKWGFCINNCTSFVAWRMNRDNGEDSFTNAMKGGLWGNAANWDDNAIQLKMIVNSVPEKGAIAQWNENEISGGYGHVAYVESVSSDGTVIISEYITTTSLIL